MPKIVDEPLKPKKRRGHKPLETEPDAPPDTDLAKTMYKLMGRIDRLNETLTGLLMEIKHANRIALTPLPGDDVPF